MKNKKCKKCEVILSINCFYIKNGKPISRCKSCGENRRRERLGRAKSKNYLKNYYSSLGLNIENIPEDQKKADAASLKYHRNKSKKIEWEINNKEKSLLSRRLRTNEK